MRTARIAGACRVCTGGSGHLEMEISQKEGCLENQMEKKMENDMETGIILYRGL